MSRDQILEDQSERRISDTDRLLAFEIDREEMRDADLYDPVDDFDIMEVLPVIDAEKALELLEQVVKGNEDFIYNPDGTPPVCVYVQNGEGSCMVGKALSLVLSIERIAALDTICKGDDGKSAPASASQIQLHIPEVTEDACEVFQAAQSIQDAGDTWGKALGAASYKAMVLRG